MENQITNSHENKTKFENVIERKQKQCFERKKIVLQFGHHGSVDVVLVHTVYACIRKFDWKRLNASDVCGMITRYYYNNWTQIDHIEHNISLFLFVCEMHMISLMSKSQ